ncbi:DNA-nicking endonuclease, Smr domain [Gemmobacter aquatilis]|uniref:DNA-nicking endonuclease, Smr domain n=1 Tax=Gemmobacter aquatilis TaxID=933059 RepID=A0A1H7YTR3_9RHOB|nr:Smr/MutS family protein [Gemmobacter aquatilis]SEM49592.1 DNA-nicking endonuclease, Smr domain [Gemmobacter aquatilis]
MARRRTLRPEEQELWQAVARTAKPMHAAVQHRKPVADATPPAPRADGLPTPPPPGLNRFRVGERAEKAPKLDVLPPLAERLATAPVLMDRKHHDRMLRGKLAPEARLDLHGMTVAEAHPELIRFILNGWSGGLRLVLVITGKGKPGPDFGPIPQRYGVLKHQVPQWLHMPPLGPCVLQVTEAHLKHGGSGAYYVYLRRPR